MDDLERLKRPSFRNTKVLREVAAPTRTRQLSYHGLTENAGREIGGPSKLQGMKLTDMKLTDQCAGHENAGHEHDGPKMTSGREIREEKVVLTEIAVQ